MQYDDIIAELGKYGPLQKRVYLMVCLVAVFAAIRTLGIVFIMPSHEHRCSIPDLANDTYEAQGEWHSDVIRRWIPWDDKLNTTSSCRIFVLDPTSHQLTNKTTTCSSHVYDQSVFKTTVTSDNDLVCDRTSLTTYANMAFMGGALAGSLALGTLSDKIGRKKALMVCIVCTQVAITAIAFVNSYILFVVIRIVAAFFGTGLFFIPFVIGMEIVHPETRKYAGLVIEIFWVLGNLFNVTLAYFIRDWKYLQLAIALPQAVLLSYAFLLPESPRWLIQKGRYKDASKIIQKAAKANKVTLSDKATKLEGVVTESGDKSENFWQLLKSKTLLFRTSVTFYIWFATSLIYMGLNLNVGSLNGNIYLNFTLSSLVEGLGYIFSILVLDRAGRKAMVCYPMLLAGLACIGTMFPVMYGGEDMQWMVEALFLMGKFGVSIAYAVVYIYSAEIFPTSVRNSAIGICAFMARFGGIIAPYIADLGKIVHGNLGIALPLIILGGSAILACALTTLLPETTNCVLPESIEDAKNFQRTPATKNKLEHKSSKVVDDIMKMEMTTMPEPDPVPETRAQTVNGHITETKTQTANGHGIGTNKSEMNGHDNLVFRI